MNCQFEESRPSGAKLLKDILPNNPQEALEVMVKTSSAHLQKPPGVSGDTKGGYDQAMEQRAQSNSGNVVLPMQPADLLARRVAVCTG